MTRTHWHDRSRQYLTKGEYKRIRSMVDGTRERMKRALEDGNDAKANEIAIEYGFTSERGNHRR